MQDCDRRLLVERKGDRLIIEYQAHAQQLLTWLSDRKQNAQDRPHAFAFLRERSKHIEFAHGDPAFAPEEEQFHSSTLYAKRP